MDLKRDCYESFLSGSLDWSGQCAREKIYPPRLLLLAYSPHLPMRFGGRSYSANVGRVGKCMTVIIETHQQCQGHIGLHHSLELGDES
jgi:hypothetical protein